WPHQYPGYLNSPFWVWGDPSSGSATGFWTYVAWPILHPEYLANLKVFFCPSSRLTPLDDVLECRIFFIHPDWRFASEHPQMQQLAAQAFAAGYWEPPIDPVIEQNGL